MLFSEMFHSIQGEGSLAGVPSIFVRTSGCNLRCWFCDTPYTSWEPERERVEWTDILERVLAIDCQHVVITGGEPMLQPDIVPLTNELCRAGRHVTIETAGTVFRPVAADLISLSPKLSNSTPREGHRPGAGKYTRRHDQLRDQPETIRHLTGKYQYQVKFVVDRQEDLDEIDEYLDRYHEIDRQCVYLMPQARRAEELREKTGWVQTAATTRNLQFSPRLQVEWWGDRRGV